MPTERTDAELQAHGDAVIDCIKALGRLASLSNSVGAERHARAVLRLRDHLKDTLYAHQGIRPRESTSARASRAFC